MTRLNVRYNWGENLSEQNPELFRQLNDVYTDLATKSNGKANKIAMTSEPPSDSPVNKNFDIGDLWIKKDTNEVWVLTSRITAESATWKKMTLT